jgi:hypothetical protein
VERGPIDADKTGEQRETMTTLENRPKAALMVIDGQNGVVDGSHNRDAVVANVGSLSTRRATRRSRHLGQALRRQPPEGRRGVADRT